MIGAKDLCALFAQALDERWGYIWGRSGQVWTQANQDAATRDMTVKYGSKWIGKRVADCSGLFVWAYKQRGEKIFHGSNTIWNKYTSAKGAVGGDMRIRPGTAVFMVSGGKRGHIGLYIGGGKCIEAKGTQAGVVMSDLSRWDEWGELADVDYTGVVYDALEVALPTLRKGDQGSAVEQLQTLLNADKRYGGLKVDGIFGTDTQSSVRAFQGDHGLKPDGIVGPKTWNALQQTEDDEPDEDKPDTPPDSPLTLEQRVERLEKEVFGEEGGDTNV